jgi:hypothetical protein
MIASLTSLLIIYVAAAAVGYKQILAEDNKIVAVKPRPELEPFFRLNLECHARDIAGDPDGIRTHDLLRDRQIC